MIPRSSLKHLASLLNRSENAQRGSMSIPNGSSHAAFKLTKEANNDEEEDALDRTSWEQFQMREESEQIEERDGPLAVGMHSHRSQIE